MVTNSSITITGSGHYVLKGVINGKNASSSGYQHRLAKMTFIPSTFTTETIW